MKLIKKNLTTNIETVVVSENDIISGPTSLFNHSALRTWLYPENDICQYTIIPYCNGKVCGDRLVFNIKKMIFPGAKQIGGNTTADKGWDGHISAGKITFPPNCFAIFCPTGSVGVDGKCVPLVTTLDGSYAISDGMLNGKRIDEKRGTKQYCWKVFTVWGKISI
ncbi:MAG: hypothetical protein IPL54_11385 [Chitinophagaceae bacterium]|nr:hypothetical protein [Chitinophagaceae bacterium]